MLQSLPSVQIDSLLNYYPPTTVSSCLLNAGYKICLAAGAAWCLLMKVYLSAEEHETWIINMRNETAGDKQRWFVMYSRTIAKGSNPSVKRMHDYESCLTARLLKV